MNMYNKDETYFRNIEKVPSLFDVKIPKEDYDHLMQQDLDPISKNEVVYKIMKQQLREQQKKLIVLKEQKRVTK